MNLFQPAPFVAEIVASLQDEPGKWFSVKSGKRIVLQIMHTNRGSVWSPESLQFGKIVWDGFSQTANTLDSIRLSRAIKQWRKR
jgi:hypothetical protein